MYPQFTNPVNDFYFRNAALQQGQFQNQAPLYPQYAQAPQMALQNPAQAAQPQVQANPNNQLITRYVTNIEEAKAAMVDALGTYLFIDTASGKIYLKRMNNNGLSDFYTYAIEETKTEDKNDAFTEINTRLSNIENTLGDLKNDKSIYGNAGNDKPARNSKATAASENESNGKSESADV